MFTQSAVVLLFRNLVSFNVIDSYIEELRNLTEYLDNLQMLI